MEQNEPGNKSTREHAQCGNCFYFDGEPGDGVQSCTYYEVEIEVDEKWYCINHQRAYKIKF